MFHRRLLEAALLTTAVVCYAPGLRAQVHARSVTEGKLVAIHSESISIRNDRGTFVFRVNNTTQIWRGGAVALDQLRLGDDLDIAYHGARRSGRAVALEIDANIANWHGTIRKVDPHSVEMSREDEHDDPDGQATIFFDDHTVFDEGAPTDLRVGGSLQVIGLDLGHDRMQATTVLTILPPPPGRR